MGMVPEDMGKAVDMGTGHDPMLLGAYKQRTRAHALKRISALLCYTYHADCCPDRLPLAERRQSGERHPAISSKRRLDILTCYWYNGRVV